MEKKLSPLEELAKIIEKEEPTEQELKEREYESSVRESIEKAFDALVDESEESEYSTQDFMVDIRKILERIRKDSPGIRFRISLQIELLKNYSIGRYSTNKVWDTFEEVIEDVIEDLEEIFAAASKGKLPDYRAYLCFACLGCLDHFEVVSIPISSLEYFVIQYYGELLPKNIKDYINRRIAMTKSTDKLSPEERDYYLESYVAEMLDLLTQERTSEEELRSFAKKYWRLDHIRQWFVNYYRRQEEWDKAVSLLEECIKRYKENQELVKRYESQLKELYPKIKDKNKFNSYKERLVTAIQDAWWGDMEKFRELKSLYSPEQWEEEREKILSCEKIRDDVLAQYLSEEELYERLAELVLDAHLQYHIFNEYASHFPSKYNEEILEKYRDYYNEMVFHGGRREYYQYVMDKLTDVHRYPGGKELTYKLTKDWLSIYKNRPAFCDEILYFRSKYCRFD